MEEIKGSESAAKKPDIKVGDVVNYVPHEDHKFDHVVRNGTVELPWVLGLKKASGGKETVEELSGNRLTTVLAAHKKKMLLGATLVAIRPNITWNATVTKVYPPDDKSPEGHVDLDVHTERGFTLHYGAGRGTARINVDSLVQGAHCCHAKGTKSKVELKHCDGSALTDKASVEVVAALNDKVAALLAEKAALEKVVADAHPHQTVGE